MVKNRRRRAANAPERRIRSLAPQAETLPDALATVVAGLMDGLSCPPTDLSALARRLAVQEISLESLPGSGHLEKLDNGYRIICSSHQALPRQRFTIAHELAHIIFEKTGRNPPREGAEVERICDMLAAECLMPTSIFRRFLPQSLTAADISRLATLFLTSRTATAIRCAQFRSLPIFGVSGNRVTWSYGGIRRGKVTNLPDQVRDAVTSILAGELPREPHCFFRSGSRASDLRRFEWLHVGKASAIVLLPPVPKVPPRTASAPAGGDSGVLRSSSYTQ